MSEYFPKTEGLLYRYFKIKKRIYVLEQEIEQTEKIIQEIEANIARISKLSNFHIPEQSMAVNMSGVYVETLPASYMDRYIEKYGLEIEKMQNKITELQKNKLHKKLKIINIQQSIQTIDIIIENLPEEEKQFIDMKYGDRMSNYQIGTRLHIGATTAGRKRKELVEKIATELGLKK